MSAEPNTAAVRAVLVHAREAGLPVHVLPVWTTTAYTGYMVAGIEAGGTVSLRSAATGELLRVDLADLVMVTSVDGRCGVAVRESAELGGYSVASIASTLGVLGVALSNSAVTGEERELVTRIAGDLSRLVWMA